MSATKEQIANNALRMIGVARITSFSDDSPAARLLSDIYEDKVQHLLRDHLWNFAVTRTSLAASTETPGWEFEFSYPLPDDCLRVLSVKEDLYVDGYRWQVEGRSIVTSIEAPLDIKYVRRASESEFDSSFRECLAAYLAAEMAQPLTRNAEPQAEMQSEAERKFRSARGSDGQEGSPQLFKHGTWVQSKHGPISYYRNLVPGRWE